MALQLSAVPEELPCRGPERRTITQFIEDGIRNGRSDKGLYISGMPGTGKTATVLQVVRSATKKQQAGLLPPFKFVMLNAMKLPDPSFLYRELLARLTGTTTTTKRATLLLQKYFSTPCSNRAVCVLLVDEIDYIMNRKQDVIYNLFNWPSQRHARLVVVGIANTMDLPERLMPRVNSRMGLLRLTFKAYTRKQIEKIIHARLTGLSNFDSDAIELCSRKVASTTGDVRKALHIARRAAEICREQEEETKRKQDVGGENDDRPKEEVEDMTRRPSVSIRNVIQATEELFHSPYIQYILHLPASQKFFLNSLMLETKKRQSPQVEYQNVVDRCIRIATTSGYQHIVPDAPAYFAQLTHSLANVHIISFENSKKSRNPMVQLLVHQDDVHFALREDEMWGKLQH
mmetsp:Transcript_6924/g.10757  ORF Transcript_6924/g.10757 Transcript_6924/m.10757 type:complete len:402 (-) Transcript_6924:92-1297(-)